MNTRSLWRIDIANIAIFLVIFWFGGWSSFFPVLISSLISIALTFCGFLCYLKDAYNNRNPKLNLIVLILTVAYPLIASIQSNHIFGQPIIYGILSLRDIWCLFIAYFIYKIATPYQILNIILKYQISIIIISAILLYIFNIDDTSLSSLKSAQDDIITTGTSENNTLRGQRLTFGHAYIGICVAYLNSLLINSPSQRKKSMFLLILILFDMLMIHKGRSALVANIFIFIIPYLRHMNIKKFFKYVFISAICIALFLSIPSIRDRFLVVFDLFGDTKTEGTGDFSGIARLSEIMLAIPLILEHPIFGVGNLSYHFNNGFIGFFLDHFYIGDIGIVGMLLVGGINLYIWYIIFFRSIQKNIPRKEGLIKTVVQSICVYSIIGPWIGSNSLWEIPKTAIILLSISLFYNYGKYKHC